MSTGRYWFRRSPCTATTPAHLSAARFSSFASPASRFGRPSVRWQLRRENGRAQAAAQDTKPGHDASDAKPVRVAMPRNAPDAYRIPFAAPTAGRALLECGTENDSPGATTRRRGAGCRLSRDSPDAPGTGVNIGAFPAFLQGRREVRTATSTSGSPHVVEGVIWPFSLALGHTPPVGCS